MQVLKLTIGGIWNIHTFQALRAITPHEQLIIATQTCMGGQTGQNLVIRPYVSKWHRGSRNRYLRSRNIYPRCMGGQTL